MLTATETDFQTFELTETVAETLGHLYAAPTPEDIRAPLVHSLVKLLQRIGDPAAFDLANLDSESVLQTFEQRLLRWLTPHIQYVQEQPIRAPHQQSQTQKDADLQTMMLDCYPVAMALCDVSGHVRWANQPMDTLLSILPKVTLREMLDPDAIRPLCRTLPVGNTEHTLIAIDMPSMGPGHVALLATTEATVSANLNASLLKTLFQLTEAECGVAKCLAQGMSCEDISQLHGTSAQTVRNQMRSVASKLSTNRPGETNAHRLHSYGDHADQASAQAERPRFVENTLLIDGRRLSYAEYGPADGKPVVLMHNWAGSRLQVPVDNSCLHSQGIRLIVPDQPGYGLSEPLFGKDAHDNLKQWPGIVAQMADALGLDQFAVMGYCSGALQALACARAMPNRVSRVVLISTFAPMRNLADIACLQASSRLMLGATPNQPSLSAPLLRMWLTHIRRHAGRYLDHFLVDLSLRDHSTMSSDAQQAQYTRSFTEAIAQHDGTPLAALHLLASDWSQLLNVQQPVTIWHGDDDRSVPPSHAQRLLLAMPKAKLNRVADEGHFLFYNKWADIVRTL